VESLKSLDKIIPGILHPSTLIYAPEIKFFDTHFPTDRCLETNIKGIFVAGDGTGKSRGIVERQYPASSLPRVWREVVETQTSGTK